MPGPYQRLDVPNVNQYVVTTAPTKRKKATTAAAAAPKPTAYDPAEHTVEEVAEYVAEHPDETDAVVKAEKAGKARVGVTSLV